jgi:arylsulfatase
MGKIKYKNEKKTTQLASKQNILLILADDMGYSDINCYGGEINTPNLNRLSKNGIRYTQFYNTARCCPSRASLLTGLHPHQTGVGYMTYCPTGLDGYSGDLNFNCVTIAEVLQANNYSTYMCGKWHVSRFDKACDPKHSWPSQRGFDSFYGIITGASNYFNPGETESNTLLFRGNKPIIASKNGYYITDAFSDEMSNYLIQHNETQSEKPFFAYLSYTAPHWPLQALPEDIKKYEGNFDKGWDNLRERRYERMINMGIIPKNWRLSPRDPDVQEWEKEKNKIWQTRRMEVYAAQVESMDRGIGKVLKTLEEINQIENTLILFLSDNGACHEELPENNTSVMPGGEEIYQSYGLPWANLSNTPFREYKYYVHEGGIATPLIIHWPQGINSKGELRHQPGQLTDIMATCLDVAGIQYPTYFSNHNIYPLEGYSLMSTFKGKYNNKENLFFEHQGNRAARRGEWKLVSKYPGPWELYNIKEDGTELENQILKYSEKAKKLIKLYKKWTTRCHVKPWDYVTKCIKEFN